MLTPRLVSGRVSPMPEAAGFPGAPSVAGSAAPSCDDSLSIHDRLLSSRAAGLWKQALAKERLRPLGSAGASATHRHNALRCLRAQGSDAATRTSFLDVARVAATAMQRKSAAGK